jgi:two-component system OmpR family sensor kinase
MIVDDLLRQFDPDIRKKTITVAASEIQKVECLCDEALTRRVIENLLDNAIKYTPEGGRICVRLGTEGNHAVLQIENTCTVLNSRSASAWFQPFYRGESARQSDVDGKGLGLYIARYIVRSHGGDVTLKITDSGTCLIEVRQPVG